MRIILKGIVGSTAYGLATEESDVDFLGVGIVPTTELFTLGKYTETVVTEDPDCSIHEIGKFCKLAANANPTILELMFLGTYLEMDELGFSLVDNRDAFLSQKVRNTYAGYATQQMERLKRRGDGSFKSKLRKRKQKHARHCARLLYQGKSLLEAGIINVKLDNPEEIRAIGELPDDELIAWFEKARADFDNTESSLSLEPDYDTINDILISARMSMLPKD